MLLNSIKINDQEFVELKDIIYQNSGIMFAENKKYLLESGNGEADSKSGQVVRGHTKTRRNGRRCGADKGKGCYANLTD